MRGRDTVIYRSYALIRLFNLATILHAFLPGQGQDYRTIHIDAIYCP